VDGLLVRSTPETEWTDEQRGWMLALAEYRATRCPCGCGQDARESLDPETEGKWVVSNVRCEARTALSIARKPYEESPQPEALLFHAERR
jgi:hypothetical protein